MNPGLHQSYAESRLVSTLYWIQACVKAMLNPSLHQSYAESKLVSTLFWIQACVKAMLNPSLCQSYAESTKLAAILCSIQAHVKAMSNPSLCQHYGESKLASTLCWIQPYINTMLNPSLRQHYVESRDLLSKKMLANFTDGVDSLGLYKGDFGRQTRGDQNCPFNDVTNWGSLEEGCWKAWLTVCTAASFLRTSWPGFLTRTQQALWAICIWLLSTPWQINWPRKSTWHI